MALCGVSRVSHDQALRCACSEPCRAAAFRLVSLVGTKAQTRRPLPAAPAAPPRPAASDLRLRSLRLRFEPRLSSSRPGAAPSPPAASAVPLAVSEAATAAAAAGFCSERGGCSGYGRDGHGSGGTAGTGPSVATTSRPGLVPGVCFVKINPNSHLFTVGQKRVL